MDIGINVANLFIQRKGVVIDSRKITPMNCNVKSINYAFKQIEFVTNFPLRLYRDLEKNAYGFENDNN